MSDKSTGKPTSGMAVTGLVLGILAVVSSWIPIINNLSFVIGLIGFVFAIVGVVGTMRGKKSGKGLAIAALVVNLVALMVVLASQSALSAAIEDATSGSSVVGTSTSDDTEQEDDAADDSADEGSSDSETSQQASTDLAVGTTIELDDGLSVTVDSVEMGLADYDGSEIVGIHVTYVNNGDEGASYNTYDWKGEDSSGAQEYPTYYIDGTDELGSGTLAAGGTKSGTIYFEGDTVKALYFASILDDTPTAGWVLE